MKNVFNGNSGGFFAVIRWHVADLAKALEKAGVPATETNITIFLNSYGPKTLENRSVEEGWEILDDIISILKNERMFEGKC